MNDVSFYEERASAKIPSSDNPEMLALVARIERWCSISDGDRVLDFGCYDGYILRNLRRRHEIQGVGVDIAPKAVELARLLSRDDQLDFLVSDGLPLQLLAGSFDVGVCSEILEHVPDFDAVLDEMARLLKPGARLYATMPNSLRDVWPPFRQLCRRVDSIEGHRRRMSKDEFVAAIASRGFHPLHVQYRGFILSAMWYRTFIYSPHLKAAGIRLVGTGATPFQRLARLAAYCAMRVYMLGDRLFSRFSGSMSIDAAFVRV